MKVNNIKLPKDLKYNKDHGWVRASGSNATIGITEIGLSLAREIVFIQLPDKGQQIKKGQDLTVLQSVKWSGHFSSPVSGEVTEINSLLFDEPSTLNEDPYGEGWVAKIRLDNPDELKELMSAKEAEEWAKKTVK